MTELGDLLVLLHGARGRISTLRATVRSWRDVRGFQAVLERADFTSYAPLGEEPEPEHVESVTRLWLAPPDCVREEREGDDGGWLGVRRGELWWHYNPLSGARTNAEQPDVGSGIGEDFGWLLDPAPAIGLLDFAKVRSARRAGRPALRVRAVPRALSPGGEAMLMRLGAWGADELVLDIDAERGALLRIESRSEGRPILISEVLEIAFDETFPPETFVFTPPPGEEVRSIGDEDHLRHDLTIEQAVALAPFTVWIPARVPADWEVEILFAAEEHRPAMAPQVLLHYRSAAGTHNVCVAQSPADHPGEHSDYEHARAGPWRPAERGDRRMEIREPVESWQPAQLRIELDGTRIHMHSSDLAADALADLAGALVRAPAEPPELG